MGAKNGHHTLSEENIKALSQSSGLEEIEIVQMFEDFLKKNPEGRLNQSDFKNLMSQSLPGKNISKMENLADHDI